jgi:Glycosyl hydrolase family 26
VGGSPGRSARLGAGVASLALAGLTLVPLSAGADPAAGARPGQTGPASGAGRGEDPAAIGIAAIITAGDEVRHLMKVSGPDPTIHIPTAATPSTSPSAPPASSRPAAASSGGIVAAWHSGASGDAATDGSFGTWRGKSLQIVGTWSDSSAQEQTDITSLDKYRDWNGDVDIALGGLAAGETWAQAASGDYVGRWTQAIATVKAKRAGRSGTTYIRFAHEMTGDWFTWKVTPDNVEYFKTSWRLFHDLLAREYPQAKLVFSPNDGNHSGVPLDQIWPGDSYVDVVGVDSYDGYPDKTSQALWDQSVESTNDGPQGLAAWLAFAKAHHKPMALPEWGLRDSDDPFYITKMHEFLASCAPRPGETDLSGTCIYDIYFNIANGGNSSFVIYGGPNPAAAQAYRSLSWGSP